ncbi:unnamed protein product [Closterium sp. NIES-53]
MESELKSIDENGTWELVELPEGRKAITSKWLFKIKSDSDGKIERYKSRLVAKGYQQKEKVDYKELFAPVVKLMTLRTLPREEIFMAQPEGFDDGSGRVLKLKKALYGLTQAPRQWYLKLRGVLEEIGFTPSTADHSLFMLGEGEQRSFMVVYADDILIFSPSSDIVKEVMLKLQDKFKCKALGDVSFYLGLHIKRDVEKRCMRVHQRKYLEALAANLGQSEGHVATPFLSGFKCVKGPEEESVGEEERRRFHSLVGSLIFETLRGWGQCGTVPHHCTSALGVCTSWEPDQSQPPLQPASPLPDPSPYTKQSGGLTERHERGSRPVSHVRTARCAPRSRPPPVPGTHAMALCPSSIPLRVPLPAPPESSLPESAAASALVAELLDFVAAFRLDYASALVAVVAELLDFAAACHLDSAFALVAESASASPPSVGGECALGTDVFEDRQEGFECLVAGVPRFASLLLAPEGDPDAPDIPTPRSYAEAITGPYSSQWHSAMDAEMASWNLKRPPGSPPAFKARYVARGFSQRQGVDYFQTFSLTPKMTTLRVLLHVATQHDYELHSLDFSTAFLQGSLHEEIWLRRPLGFTGSFPTSTQWSLKRPVYALRQAPREWHDTLRTTLAALGFAPSTVDPSLFLRTDTPLPPLYVLVYVDDLVFATADTEAVTLVKSELQKRHTCTDLGELHNYLGQQITRDIVRRTITLTQSHMVHQVLQRFGFQYSSLQLTPLSTSHSLRAPPSDESVAPSCPYPEVVGCLMYLMTCTRLDLTYPLSLLARYVAPSRQRKVHWDAAKRVLRYLCSTSGLGLVLGGRGPVVLTDHTDASWVDDSATQRSSQGYTFSLGSGLVSWRSTRSSSVLSSSCEAEIYAGATAAQELCWLTYLLTNLGEQPCSPPVLFQRGHLRLAYVANQANTADRHTPMDAEMVFWKSRGTYVDAVPLSGVNIVDGIWIFRVKRLPGSPPVFKARYVARCFSQQQGVDFFHSFSPTPKMTTLWVLLHVAAQRDYELHSLDFITAFLQGSLHEDIWLRRPPGFTWLFPVGTQWSLRRPVYGLCQAPPEWHDTLRMTLPALGFAPSTTDPSLFLCTDTSLPPFYVLVYINDFVFATADTEALALVK